MTRVVTISAGSYSSRKHANVLRSRMKYLNYGLLGLSTLMSRKHDVRMFQGDATTPGALIERMNATGWGIENSQAVLLSIPSFYAVPWAADFCELIQREVIVGGRWVVDGNIRWLHERLKASQYVEGFGEKPLMEMFGIDDPYDGKERCFEHLDYRLLDGYERYQPCIEVSRGCGAGCAFCLDRRNPRLRNKPVSEIESELNWLDGLYKDYSYYLEAPHFRFENSWVEEFCEMVGRRRIVHPWRCTSRVESVRLEDIGRLADTGLKVIDVGLESASPTQLKRMGKTARPEVYLEQAEIVLEKCREYDVWVKFNLLLYAGETDSTVGETRRWLEDHASLIKDISVSNLVYYRGMDNLSEFVNLGASIHDEKLLEETGYSEMDLSSDIDCVRARQLCLELPRVIATQRDFYDVKMIGYFPIQYTYDDFLNDVSTCDPSDLPFRLETI